MIINYEHIYAGFNVTPETLTWPNATVSIENQSMTDANSYVWNFDDGNTQTDNSFVGSFNYTYTNFGVYNINLQVNGTNCSNNTEHTVTINEAGAVHENNTNDIFIYPNPSDNFITIRKLKNERIEGIKIFDFSGRLIKYENSFPVNIKSLENGVYFVKIKTTIQEYNLKAIKK